MSLPRSFDIASLLICRHEHHELVCRPPVPTAVALGIVLSAFLALLMINTLATLRRGR